MSKTLIAPSILAADFGNLQRDVEMINQSDAHWFHLDVMDGVFVPWFGGSLLFGAGHYCWFPGGMHCSPTKFRLRLGVLFVFLSQ